MSNFHLTKSTNESDLKQYFTAVLQLSKADKKFPVNLDEVWPLVYAQKDKAVRALKKEFIESEDFTTFTQNGDGGKFTSITYFISVSCLEYFIARKVRPVFEVYRQVFHRTAQQPITTTHDTLSRKDLALLIIQAEEEKEKLQLENKRLQDDIVTKDNLNSLLAGENDELRPKGRIYDQVMQSPEGEWLKTTSSVANEIGMSAQRLNKLLVACGVIYKAQSGEYLFTNEYIGWNLGKLVSCVINEEKGQITTYIKWNTRGRAYIHALHDTNWDKRRAWHLLRTGENNSLTKNN